MQSNRPETTVIEDGIITLRDVPFRRGDSVEVIILPFPVPVGTVTRYPLRGKPVKLVAPTEPVANADWEAGR